MSQESCVCGFCDGSNCGNTGRGFPKQELKNEYPKQELTNHWPEGVPQRYAQRCTCVVGYPLTCPKHGYGNR